MLGPLFLVSCGGGGEDDVQYSPVPLSIVMGNARSPSKKIEELAMLT